MLRMNGDTMLGLMQARCEQLGCPEPMAIACTGNTSHHDVDAYLRAGFRRVLGKPFSQQQLCAALHEVLGTAQAQVGGASPAY